MQQRGRAWVTLAEQKWRLASSLNLVDSGDLSSNQCTLDGRQVSIRLQRIQVLAKREEKEAHGLWYSGVQAEALMEAMFSLLWNTILHFLSVCHAAFEINEFHSRNHSFVFRPPLESLL